MIAVSISSVIRKKVSIVSRGPKCKRIELSLDCLLKPAVSISVMCLPKTHNFLVPADRLVLPAIAVNPGKGSRTWTGMK